MPDVQIDNHGEDRAVEVRVVLDHPILDPNAENAVQVPEEFLNEKNALEVLAEPTALEAIAAEAESEAPADDE